MNKFYVTTSIPYVNDSPHLGHAMEFIVGDVLARYARQSGDDVIFSIGTDEHGGKVADKAATQGVSPKEYADKISKQFQNLAKDLNLSNDLFIRTTDANHEKAVQKIWTSLKSDIYKGRYKGWYCTGDEAFFTEAYVKEHKGVCPNHNRPFEKIEEENYFFKLSKYNDAIKQAIESDEFRIIPLTRRKEILTVLKDGLDDISISRPSEKISWGIGVPDDDTQVIYVWFEALLNYITGLNYPHSHEFKDFWPPNYQVIGKDILRFHAANFPATLLALNLPLAKNLFVHGFINVDNQKMSKSLGNSIAPKEIIDKYGTDSFRYYFLRHIPSYEDGDFSWEKMKSAYDNELANELGNALQRTIVMVANYLGGKVNKTKAPAEDKQLSEAIQLCQFDRALDLIWTKARSLNQYIEDNKPWLLNKEGKHEELEKVLNSQVNQLRQIALMLKAFLPETSQKMSETLDGKTISIPKQTLFPRLDD